MYNISAENMESVATALDPILVDLRQCETMNVRTISCNMMQILTLFWDVTVPIIELMAQQMIYTNSNNANIAEMKIGSNDSLPNPTAKVLPHQQQHPVLTMVPV